jgi:hypothetical protein
LFNLDTTTVEVSRVTNTLSKDYHPKALDENNFYYLSDQRGIVNLFKFNRQNGIYSQITNFNSSIKDFDLDFYNRSLALVTTKQMSEDIFMINNFNFDRQIFTPASRRKEIQQAKSVTEKRKQEPVKNMSIKDLINARLKEKQDTTQQKSQLPEIKKDTIEIKSNVVNVDDYQFDDGVKVDTLKPLPLKDKPLNTDDYVFEDEVVKAKQPSETFLTRYMKARESNRVTGPFSYTPKFTYENVATNFVIDPLRGFSMRIETQMNDMLENYRILGGIQTAFDFKSGDVYAEFQYLPRLIDFSVRFDRKVIFWETPQESISQIEEQKYSFQKIEFGASLPLSVRTRVTLKPFGGFTQFLDRGFVSPQGGPVFRPAEQQFYGGAKAELVYDNSLSTGMNIIEGTRAKLGAIHYQAIGNNQKSFSQVSLDVRHYQKIYREIVFAVRAYTGTFLGNSPKKYLLGGMDNWFSNNINYEGLQNPLTNAVGSYNENLLFAEFATNLRGFDYATLYGNSVAMVNAEFRVPLIRALSSGPITSNFFRNLQFTAFYDIGTSWTGALPFNAQNSVRQRVVPDDPSGSPFLIQLNEYLNPWLYSYGLGLRTMMLGYYIKFDLAWPVENYTVKDPRVFVTLGFDF